AIGGNEIGDVGNLSDEEVGRLLTEAMPDKSEAAIKVFVGYWKLFRGALVGDLVVLPTRNQRVAIGELVGPYFYFSGDVDDRARHRREVSWIARNIDRNAFHEDLRRRLGLPSTIIELKGEGAVERLRTLASMGVDPGPAGDQTA